MQNEMNINYAHGKYLQINKCVDCTKKIHGIMNMIAHLKEHNS